MADVWASAPSRIPTFVPAFRGVQLARNLGLDSFDSCLDPLDPRLDAAQLALDSLDRNREELHVLANVDREVEGAVRSLEQDIDLFRDLRRGSPLQLDDEVEPERDRSGKAAAENVGHGDDASDEEARSNEELAHGYFSTLASAAHLSFARRRARVRTPSGSAGGADRVAIGPHSPFSDMGSRAASTGARGVARSS